MNGNAWLGTFTFILHLSFPLFSIISLLYTPCSVLPENRRHSKSYKSKHVHNVGNNLNHCTGTPWVHQTTTDTIGRRRHKYPSISYTAYPPRVEPIPADIGREVLCTLEVTSRNNIQRRKLFTPPPTNSNKCRFGLVSPLSDTYANIHSKYVHITMPMCFHWAVKYWHIENDSYCIIWLETSCLTRPPNRPSPIVSDDTVESWRC